MDHDIDLIIGASGVSGQAAIQAIRNKQSNTMVIGTTSSDKDIPNCDTTIHNINFKETDSVQKMIVALPKNPRIKMMAFIPAKGRVAMPATSATAQQIKDSVRFSIIPMLKLISILKPEITVCHSAFIQLSFLREIYGAMNFTKYLMDDLAIKNPEKLKAIRFGVFDSEALRGILLLFKRSVAAGFVDEKNPVLMAWKKSGLSLESFFKKMAAQAEAEAFEKQFDSPYRITESRDITKAYEMILAGEKAPILNVIGNWIWTDHHHSPLPAAEQEMAKTMLPNLDDYLK